MLLIKNLIILLYIVQRLFELFLSLKNELILKSKFNATYSSKRDSTRMKIFHITWFIFLIFESNQNESMINSQYMIPILIVLAIAQAIRFYTVFKLGIFWTINIMKMNPHPIIGGGLFKIIRHPNYFAVILEFIFLPLLFKSYYTLFIFSFLNIFILRMRIQLEESELNNSSNYSYKFKEIKKIIPLFY